MNNIRIGALISGGGTNLQAVIDACESGKINGQMVFVGSDNPKAYGLERAKKHGISTFITDYAEIIREFKAGRLSMPEDADINELLSKQSLFHANTPSEKARAFVMTRAIAERKLLEQMASYPFDLMILAGFMRNLTPYFIDRVNTDSEHPRIMNIHPALLPAFPGTDGYGDTFRYGCKIGGCTVHFIDYGEDSGPIIGQRSFPIEPDDTLDAVKKKGLELEWQLYPQCIQLFAENRLRVVRKTYTLENGKTSERRIVEII